MNFLIKTAIAALIATSVSSLGNRADAAPLSASLALRDAITSTSQTVQWRGGGWRGGWGGWHGGWAGRGAGFAAGAFIGGALAGGSYYGYNRYNYGYNYGSYAPSYYSYYSPTYYDEYAPEYYGGYGLELSPLSVRSAGLWGLLARLPGRFHSASVLVNGRPQKP